MTSNETPELPNDSLGHISSSAEASAYITVLLVAEPFPIDAVRKALSRFGSRFQLALDASAMSPISVDSVRRVIRRVIGTAVLPDQLCSLLYSLKDFPDADELYGSAVGDAFGNFVCLEYPETSRRFFNDHVKALDPGSPWKQLLEQLLEHLESVLTVYRELPRLKELRPSVDKLIAYQAFKRRQNREILAIAEEKSIFHQFVTNVDLKYGQSFTSRYADQFSPVTELQEFSYFIELPRSELYDPVLGTLRRRQHILEAEK